MRANGDIQYSAAHSKASRANSSREAHPLELLNQVSLLLLRLNLHRLHRLQYIRRFGAMTQHGDNRLFQSEGRADFEQAPFALERLRCHQEDKRATVADRLPDLVRPGGPRLDGKGRQKTRHSLRPEIGFEFAGEVLVFGRVAEKDAVARLKQA